MRSSVIYPGEVETPILDARPFRSQPSGGRSSCSPKTSPPRFASWSSCIRGRTCPSW